MMKLILILLLSLNFTSCFQQSNSSTSDASSNSEVDEDASNEFAVVFNIVKGKCFGCHNHSFESLTKEEDWIKQQSQGVSLISKGSANDSNLIKRMKNCSSGTNADMPTRGDALTQSECDIVKSWINEL